MKPDKLPSRVLGALRLLAKAVLQEPPSLQLHYHERQGKYQNKDK
jgi:hypothetical protein